VHACASQEGALDEEEEDGEGARDQEQHTRGPVRHRQSNELIDDAVGEDKVENMAGGGGDTRGGRRGRSRVRTRVAAGNMHIGVLQTTLLIQGNFHAFFHNDTVY
jgi:hypothetical protein